VSHIYDALRRARGGQPRPGDAPKPAGPETPPAETAGTPPAVPGDQVAAAPDGPAPPAPDAPAGPPEPGTPAAPPAPAAPAGPPEPVAQPSAREEERAAPRRAVKPPLEEARPVEPQPVIPRPAVEEPVKGRRVASPPAERSVRAERPPAERLPVEKTPGRKAGAKLGSGLMPQAIVAGNLIGDLQPTFLRELEGLRASVEVQLGRSARKVLGFTGAVSGEGATTLAMHYAYLVARAEGKRILLVDGDLGRAKPGLSGPVGPRPGLSDLLQGGLRPEEVILGTEVPELHFLPAGGEGVNAVDAAHSPHLHALADRLGELYDWVVADLPAVLEHPETPLLASACDGVVLVIRAHRTPRALSQRALDLLQVSGCRILGTILNGRKECLPGFLRQRV